MTFNSDGIRVSWSGLLTLSLIALLGLWTASSALEGTLLSPPLWSAWLGLSVLCLIGTVRLQLSGLMSLSNKTLWPVVLSLFACLVSVSLLLASLFN